MHILVCNGRRRTLALVSHFHVLLFRFIESTGKCAIELIDKNSFISNSYKQLSRSKNYGFLGLIEMNNDIFLCMITSKIQTAQPLKGENINKIQDVEFYSLTNDIWDFIDLNSNGYPNIENDQSNSSSSSPSNAAATTRSSPSSSLSPSSSSSLSSPSQNDLLQRIPQHPCWELRKLLSDGSFFYSSDFDLTSTLQSRGINIKQRLSMDQYHTDYMWNDFMMNGIINFRNNLTQSDKLSLDNNHFLTTVIRGFAETLSSNNYQITIISKQSWKRAGTRFNVRGVDDDGNVANYVETELIFNDNYNMKIFAFTQIRGSIPIFWEQDTALISPKVQITRSFDATQPTFEKHFQNSIAKYGPIHIVNLLSNTRSSEIELSKTYLNHYKALINKNNDNSYSNSIFFTNFDFHQETSKTYADATKLLPYLMDSFNDFGYFLYDLKTNQLLNEQIGTFRTNCLDCLDRTNLIQQVISLNVLINYLNSNHINYNNDLKTKHNTLWANHGDRISQIYTGTNALKSSFSRSGKMGFAGALSDATKSISRIYINNFVDKNKQQITDTLLGKISSQNQVIIYDPIIDYINENLKNYESNFTSYDNITIFTGTFNLAGANQNKNLTDWLFPYENFNPDIFIVGFQEVIELNASNILKNDSSIGDYWTNEVERTIKNNTNDNYILLRSEFMSSILLLLFVKSNHVSKVTEVEGKSKKTGLGGITANKGTVAIRFKFCSTSFCFVNSHLTSGLQYTDERNNDFINSFNGIRFSRNKFIKNHDNIIWLGDLNYRISLPNEKVRLLIEKNDINNLLLRDQLSIQLLRVKEFKFFKESEITFLPTYKFDKNSNNYDSSEKQRVPAYTDRILFKGKNLNSLDYNIASIIKFSDHRPVYNIFNSKVKIIDEQIKDDLINKLKNSFNNNSKLKSKSNSNNFIDLNDAVSSSPSSSTTTTNTSSSTSSNLIDLDTSTTISPPLPKRSIPPVYNAQETKNMLIPGLTPSNIMESTISTNTSNTNTPPKLPTRKPPPPSSSQLSNTQIESNTSNNPSLSSFQVMTPTLSRSGSLPPPPPPRKSTNMIHSESNTTASSSSTTTTTPIVNSSSPTMPKEHKFSPIVPTKPKVLNTIYNENTSTNSTTSTNTNNTTNTTNTTTTIPTTTTTPTWTAMAPTKKL